MKLRNKRTGEIGWLYCDHIGNPKRITVFAKDRDLSANHWDYIFLAELNEEWEDYKEPKWLEDYWFIDSCGCAIKQEDDVLGSLRREIGNYFETKEEAEKAVKRLRAWKRLKDKGLEVTEWSHGLYLDKTIAGRFRYKFPIDNKEDIEKDLDLLIGGEG